MLGKLIIARHNESEWSKIGRWTGVRDRHLTDNGFKKSEEMAGLIKDLSIDYAFASMQVRSIETLSSILTILELYHVPTEHSNTLNERDYGDYTAKNKWEMERLLGAEEFRKLRRSWDYPVPNGETLRMVYDRAVPYFLDHVLPLLREGKNVLVVAHGNSLRTLIKYIESLSDEGVADVEMPFNTVIIYDLDDSGHIVHKEIRQIELKPHTYSKAQIVATIGPASDKPEILQAMIHEGFTVARFNFSWADLKARAEQIALIREFAREAKKVIPIIVDLPGYRIQKVEGHTYNDQASHALTKQDTEFVQFSVLHEVEYLALSFVGGVEDIVMLKETIKNFSGKQRIIAKIERKIAVDCIDSIIDASDAIMIARGDLGNEVPLEQIPFIQESIIKKCKEAGKPVITATQMLLSMTENSVPTRAEVTDVTNAILQGSDAVMLSEETAKGKYPVEAVNMMEKIISETILHEEKELSINPL